MKIGKVEQHINDIINSGKGVFMPLIDPEKQTPEEALKTAKIFEEGGADLILIGGSTGLRNNVVSDTAKLIKENVNLPVHLFPGNVSNTTMNADSIYFMSLLNSKNPYWISGIQSLGAVAIKKMMLETIPTAYLVFEPGETVGRISESNLLPTNRTELAIGYSLAAQYMGMRFVILESGSGAPEPVPLHIVTDIKRNCDNIKIVIAGGVKTPEQARSLIKAGAHCIHVGTCLEGENCKLETVKAFATGIHLE